MANAMQRPHSADPELDPAELRELVEVFRLLLRWDLEAQQRSSQGDDFRTDAPPAQPR